MTDLRNIITASTKPRTVSSGMWEKQGYKILRRETESGCKLKYKRKLRTKSPQKLIASIINPLFFFGAFFKGKIYPGFTPNKNDLVIDIGCGDKPFWRADVCLDNLSLGSEQRFSSTGVVKDIGLFINSDLTKTPFKDKAFDFSFCSHVLEHVERPDLAIKEIVRISKRGYIEVPNGLIEIMSPYESHLWFVFCNENELFFLRKGRELHEFLKRHGSKYSYLAKLIRDPFIQLSWKNNIKYKVIDNLRKKEKYFSTDEVKHIQPYYIQKVYLIIVKVLWILFYRKKAQDINALKILIYKHG